MPTPTFDEVWRNVRGIHGHFRVRCAQKLFQYAMLCKPGSEFVEIGSYCGRSAGILGQVALANYCHLTLVDDFTYELGARELTRQLHAARLGCFPYTLMVMPSEKAVKRYSRWIDLLHIDGDHSGATQDALWWLPKLKVGGWALFHDWGQSAPNVMEAVAALEGYQDLGTFASLAIRRKL